MSAYGLPDDVISDRGLQFVSKFWEAFCGCLGIANYHTSGYHPEANGQAEVINKILTCFLHSFLLAPIGNWVELLPLAEFAFANSHTASHKSTPFYVLRGYHPCYSTNTILSKSPVADVAASNLTRIWDLAHWTLAEAQLCYKSQADHKCLPALLFKVGDKVWLLRTALKDKIKFKKLQPRKLGPFKVLRHLGKGELKLPVHWCVHNFHASYLEPVTVNSFHPATPKPKLISVDGSDEFEVEYIVDSRYSRKKLQYLVHWKDFSVADRSWEPAHSLAHSKDLVQQFHAKHPEKPGGSKQ